MYYQRDTRYPKGGFHYCSVKARKRAMEVYDTNPVYRIEKSLKAGRRKRLATIERMKGGSLPIER